MSAPAMARACTGRACMRLEYTERQNKFREEIRGWLATHVPKQPLTSFDTEAGFAAHRDWEAKLFEGRSEEHTSELQSLMRISYAVFCLKKKKKTLTIS